MYVKIQVPLKPGEWWMMECEKAHYRRLSLSEFDKFMEKKSIDLVLVDERLITSPNMLEVQNAISHVTLVDKDYTVAFSTVGYLLNNRGRTIERMYTEPTELPDLRKSDNFRCEKCGVEVPRKCDTCAPKKPEAPPNKDMPEDGGDF